MVKKFKRLAAAVLSLIQLATLCTAPMSVSAEDTNLRFGEDGKFKIVIFSDVQDQYPVHQRVIRIMEQAIARENPDLVVFTGDMTEINTKDVEVDYRRTVEQILAPVVEAGIPYSIVFGNHDNQSYYSGQVTDREDMLAVWQSIGDCRTTDPAPELTGAGTCKVPIYSSNGNNLAFNLWMVDSGSWQNPLDTKSGYDNPHADQIAWMKENNDAEVNSLVFQHIPMPETYNLFVEDANGEKTYGDKKYKLELKEGVVGTAGEFPATIYADDNTGEFQALKEMGNVLGVFNGHDHLNDFSGTYDGIRITSVPGMSYFNYGDEAIRGYGVIELDESDLSDYEYNSVKYSTLDAEAGTSTEITYDAYDEITYSDLKENGNALGSEYTISGGHTFTYDATSPSKSAIFKYRWTAGSKPGYQVSFDLGNNGNISYPFGLWIKRADQTGPNGAWHLKPNVANLEVKMTEAAAQGNTYDIELGRLKVLTGEPQYVGMYYVYLKVNGVLIQEGYTNTDENGGYTSDGADCQISNVIRFGGWGNGGDDKISASPFTEVYEDYDEITYEDLIIGGNPAAVAGIDLGSTREYTYNATSETFSTIFKYRWIAGTSPEYSLYYDYWGNYPFGLAIKGPNSSNGGGDTAGENGAWHVNPAKSGNLVNMSESIVAGQAYDIEFARLKVKNGDNKGKYRVYLKVDGELVHEYYVEATEGLTNKILFVSGSSDNSICATPENYAHDEITYDDLIIGGNPAAAEGIDLGSTREYTYTPTSETYSTAFKFRWTAGANPEFSLYFDYWGNYPFGLAVKGPNSDKGGGATAGENGAWHVNPAKSGNIVNMSEPIVEGETYDIEFGRIKVKTGENGGKYNVYLKVNDELIQSYYTEATEELTNKILFVSSTEDNFIFGYPEEEEPEVPEEPEEPESPYYEYDEIGYDNLYVGDISMAGQTMTSNQNYTYNATSSTYSVIFKYRWIPGGNEMKFTTFFDDWVYPFCFAAKTPNQTGFGAAAGENGAWHLVPSKESHIVQMDEPVVAGEAYDIEIARLKVKTGDNAGKYHVYAKVNGELIKEYYYDGVNAEGKYGDGTALSNKIIIAIPAGNSVTATPFVEEYEAYDEVGFENLTDSNGNALGTKKHMSGATTLNYNSTSPTGSVLFKYNWTVGSVPKFQMSFEKTADAAMGYMFGAWLSEVGAEGTANYPNGRMWLRPAYGPEVDMPSVLVSGNSYNVEFARLKVANGPNKGKYYVYIKIDDDIIAEDYVDASLVDANGNYVTKPGDVNCNVKSGEIFFAFWDSENNEISAYKEKKPIIMPEGTKGDFDGDSVINASDLVFMKKILLGLIDMSEKPEGIADFNNDGETDILDLIAIKKYLAPVNSYAKSGKLSIGVQEHLGEDESKTAEYIADATAALGANSYRLSKPIHDLYYVTATNGVAVREDNMAAFKEMVAELKERGINDILYVTDSFILPVNYSDPTKNHNITVPNPNSDTENYIAWLEVNAAAFKALAEEVPEIKFFEPYNEINLRTTRLERNGCAWSTTTEEQAAYKFTVTEKAGIMADLCWYISKAVKSVDSANQVTSPSIVVGSNKNVIEDDFIDAFYNAIESGSHPINKGVADTRVDNYFTIVNLHAYPDYAEDDALLWDNFESNANKEVNEWAGYINEAYNKVKAHNDGSSRVWITETGMSTYGEARDEENVSKIITKALTKLDNELTFIDTVIFYQIADMSTDWDASASETYFGLFYCYDDIDYPYQAKLSAKAIYSYIHDGSTDYSAIDAFVAKYAPAE